MANENLERLISYQESGTYDDPAFLVEMATGEDRTLAVAAVAAMVNAADPIEHADDLLPLADVATQDVDALAEDWAQIAAEHDLDPEPPMVHTAVAALRVKGDDRYLPTVERLLDGSDLARLAGLLALGDDPSPRAEELLRREVERYGDDAATASLLNARALSTSQPWARAAADLFQEKGWSRRQAASFLRVAGELIADSEDLTQYDDLVALAEDDTLSRGLRRFALGYALSFDLEPEDEKQEKLQRAHVRRVVAVSKSGIVPLVETEVPAWFRGRVDEAVLD